MSREYERGFTHGLQFAIDMTLREKWPKKILDALNIAQQEALGMRYGKEGFAAFMDELSKRLVKKRK